MKLLDFGLAKPTERAPSSVDTEAATQMMVNTSPGMVMGTVNYMSPEQARGYTLDARTDIWSLGVVLYEMVAGRVPFSGETTSDVIVAVLDREPPMISGGAHEAPLELQRILRKALRKDKEERYQTVKDLLVDLRALKQEVDFEMKLETSIPPESRSLAAFNTISAQTSIETERDRATHTHDLPAARTTLGAGRPASRVKQGERVRQIGVLVAVVVFAAAITGMIYMYLHQKSRKAGLSLHSVKITRLTANGKSIGATISPDGKIVAHIVSDAGQKSLWVRQVATSRNLQIVPPAEVDYFGLTIAPDGNHVYYVTGKVNEPVRELYQVSVYGGTPKKVLTDVDSPVTFSPDGKQIVFMRGEPTSAEWWLMVANADGTGERKLAIRKAPLFFEVPAWSPDGQTIAVSAGDTSQGKMMTVVGVNVEDGTERPLTSERWLGVGQLTWMEDGSGLAVVAADQDTRLSQLWYVSYPDGAAKRLTNDLNNYGGVSLSKDSDSLVTVRFDQSSNVWVVPVETTGVRAASLNRDESSRNTSLAHQLTSGGVRYYGGAWTPDGKIVYSSDASGARDLWIMDADGGNQKQLTADAGTNFSPTVSPDGQFIVFISDRGGRHNLWRIGIDGGNPVQLTNVNYARNPTFSPDSKWIVYAALGEKSPTLWRIPIGGGEPVRLTDKYSVSPVVSPDGKFIACHYWEETTNAPLGIALIPFEGGQPVKIFNIPAPFVRWSPDGRALTYIDNRGGISNIWSQPLDSEQPKQLTDFKNDQIFAFDWSRDGRSIVCTRGVITSDVVLFSDLE